MLIFSRKLNEWNLFPNLELIVEILRILREEVASPQDLEVITEASRTRRHVLRRFRDRGRVPTSGLDCRRQLEGTGGVGRLPVQGLEHRAAIARPAPGLPIRGRIKPVEIIPARKTKPYPANPKL